jgi:hypothetical protein
MDMEGTQQNTQIYYRAQDFISATYGTWLSSFLSLVCYFSQSAAETVLVSLLVAAEEEKDDAAGLIFFFPAIPECYCTFPHPSPHSISSFFSVTCIFPYACRC